MNGIYVSVSACKIDMHKIAYTYAHMCVRARTRECVYARVLWWLAVCGCV